MPMNQHASPVLPAFPPRPLTVAASRHARRRRVALRPGLLLPCLCALGLSAAATGARAETGDESAAPAAAPAAAQPEILLGDVVVTVRRKSEKLLDVPAVVTAMSGAELSHRHIDTVADALRVTGLVSVSSPYGEAGAPNSTIRGVTSTDFSQNQSKPIAMYIDEGVKNFLLLEATPLFDIERVEVLAGPQGTLYGKNASGGAVNIISRTPTFRTNGYVTVGFGNFGRRTAQGAVELPLVNDVLGARVAVYYAKDDGKLTNRLVPGENGDQTDVLALRAALRFQPAVNLDATLRFSHVRVSGRDNVAQAGNVDYDVANLSNIAAIPGASREGLGFYDIAAPFVPQRILRSNNVNLQLRFYAGSRFDVTSITTYDWGEQGERIVPDIPVASYYGQQDAPHARQFVQDVRAHYTIPDVVDLQAGAFYSHDYIENFVQYIFNQDPRCGPACDFGLGLGGTGFYETFSFRQRRDSYAAYLKGEAPITRTIKISAGLRHSWDDIAIYDYNSVLGDSAQPFGLQTIIDEARDARFQNISLEAGVNWQPGPRTLFYLNYREGYRTGAFNGGAAQSPDELTTAPPEQTRVFELGAKAALFDGRLTITSDVFIQKYKDQQVLIPSSEGGTVLFPLRSIPKARIRGFEFNAVAEPAHGIVLMGNLSLLDPVYVNGIVGDISVTGNQMTNAPKINLNLNADVGLYDQGGTNVRFNLNGNYRSRLYFDAYNSRSTSQRPYWLVDGRLSLTRDQFKLSFHVNNLFNKKYIVYSFVEQPILGWDYLIRGSPRSYGADLSYSF
jgi:outer membrane receptor protein involved in Fe transport